MKKIKLTKNQYTLVDDADYSKLEGIKWYASLAPSNKYYASSGTFGLLHRYLLSPTIREEVDHINGNSLDNRRENLRICTHAENMKNRKMHKNNKSGFKGVVWNKIHSRCRAYIKVEGKNIALGSFLNPEAAHEAYKKAANYYHKGFASY